MIECTIFHVVLCDTSLLLMWKNIVYSLLLHMYILISDGSSHKKTSPGRARALRVELEPGPSLGPSEKVEPEP